MTYKRYTCRDCNWESDEPCPVHSIPDQLYFETKSKLHSKQRAANILSHFAYLHANDARTSANYSLAMAELADELDKISCSAAADITRLEKQYDSKLSVDVARGVCRHNVSFGLHCQLCREEYRPNSGNEIDPRRG